MQKGKLFLFLFISIFLVGSISALEFDNIKRDITFDRDSTIMIGGEEISYKEIWEKYGPIRIDNWLGLGETLWEGAIDTHTESCGSECTSTIDINLANDGSLIDDIEFYTIKEDGIRVNQDIRSYQLYIKTGEIENTIQDYEWQCINVGDILKNGSQEQSCSNVNIGSHIESEYTWEEYNIGDLVRSGNHKLKLEGEKKSSRTVDWVIKTNGEWINSWAIWGESTLDVDIVAYYNFDELNATDFFFDIVSGFDGSTNFAVEGLGIINNSLDGTGASANDKNQVPSFIDIDAPGELTWNIWVNTTGFGTGQRPVIFFGEDSSFGNKFLGINGGGFPFVQFGDGTGVSEAVGTTSVINQQWNMITVVANTTLLKIYVNGTLEHSVSQSGWGNSQSSFHIGSRSINSEFLRAKFDETGIWNRTLTDSEITDLYNSGNAITYPFGISFVSLNSPANNTVFLNPVVEFNCSAIHTVDIVNMSLMTNQSGTFEIVNTTDTSGLTNETIWNHNLETDGEYIWSCQSCDTDGDCGFGDENRTVTIDTTSPIITLTSPSGIIDSIVIGNNLSLNWTVSDPSLDTCFFDYNNINTTVTCTDNNHSFITVLDKQSITFYANDTVGNSANETTSWSYSLIENNITFNNQTNEGSLEVISINIILNDTFSINQARLVYNNTNFTSSIVFAGGQYLISSTITAPLVDENTNISFFFVIDFDSQEYISTVNTQEVLDLQFSSCGFASNDTLLNVSLVDETTRNTIFGDVQISANIISKTSGEVVETISDEFLNASSGAICFSPPESYNLYLLDAQIRYSSPDFVSEFYIIQKADLGDFPLNLTLFDLDSNSSTRFLITYQDNNLINVEGAVIQLLRKYIANDTFETVEAPETSNLGTTVLHIDLDTNIYRAIVVKQGVTLDFFDNLVFNCQSELSGQCEHSLLGSIDPRNSISVEILNDFAYIVTNVNNTVTTMFTVPSGTPSSINIAVTQVDGFGNTDICNQTIFSSAGSIDCVFSNTIGNSMLFLEITKDSELQAQQSYVIQEGSGIDWEGNNFFIVLLILLSFAGMAISSPEWMIINGIVTFVLAGGLWLLQGLDFVMGLSGIIWLIVSGGILIYKIAQQEDR